jgi:hypothetical protein
LAVEIETNRAHSDVLYLKPVSGGAIAKAARAFRAKPSLGTECLFGSLAVRHFSPVMEIGEAERLRETEAALVGPVHQVAEQIRKTVHAVTACPANLVRSMIRRYGNNSS